MRRSRRTLNELVVELSQAPARPNICARCNFIFDYPEGAPWSEAFRLVCDHWKTCLADVSGEVVPSPGGGTTPTDTGNRSPCTDLEATPPLRKRKRSASQSAVGPSRIRKKNVMDKGTRRQLIERDVWARNTTPKSVECKGCGRTIKLDKRSDYYPGLWHKHRNKCPAIQRVENPRNKQKGDDEMMSPAGNTRSSAKVEYISSPTDTLRTRHEELDRISKWTASSGLRYHTASSCATGSPSRSTSPVDERALYTVATRTSDSRYIKEQSNRGYIPREDIEKSDSDDTGNSGDENYWEDAPFRPGKESVDSSDSASGRCLYRYSTRRELLTRYRNGASQGGKAGESCSEEVMQAARYLVSMKSRTSV